MTNKITTSQTIGPFAHEAWRWAVDLTAKVESSEPTVIVKGAIFDGDGAAINDGWIEVWMPDSVQAEATHAIPGYRRVPSADDGGFSLQIATSEAIGNAGVGKPVAYVTVFGAGLTKHQFTAIFLDDDTGLGKSEVLNQVPQKRRETLIAKKQGDGSYLWNIYLQGAQETVFFDYV